MKDIILNLQKKFDTAELHADANTLKELLANDFRSIGPKGYILDKTQWIERHQLFKYQKLEISEAETRLYEKTAIVINVQKNKATYNEHDIELAVRVAQVWVDIQGKWQLASIQFSPMEEM